MTHDRRDRPAPRSGSARPPRCSASPSRRSGAGRPRAGCAMERSEGGQRLVDDRGGRAPARRAPQARRPTDRSSPSRRATGSRASSPGSRSDRVAAVVEVIAGPHRLVSLMTAEAVDELGLKVGDEAVCVVKATNVDRRDPVRRGSRAREVAPRRRSSAVVAASSPPARAAAPSPSAAPSAAPTAPHAVGRRAGASSRSTAPPRSRARSTRPRPPTRRPNPGTTLTISTDSSAALETQIEQGAPADVFLSADTTNPKKLVDKGLAAGAAVAFAGNKLTIIVPTDNPAGITTPADLAKTGVKVIAAGDDGADHEVRDAARRQPRQGSRLPGRLRRRLHREHRLEGGQRQGGRRQDRARRGRRRRSSTSPTPRPRPRSRPIDVPDCRQRPGDLRRRRRQGVDERRPRPQAFLDWFAGPDGQAILGGFGFLPPS